MGGSGQRRLAGKRLLVGLGAQRAGTTWLAHYLRNHGEAFSPHLKALNYFDALLRPGAAADIEARLRRQAESLARRRPKPELAEETRARLAEIADRTRMRGDAHDYLSFFAERVREERVFCDITPGYALLDAQALKSVAGVHADVRFVFIMRDPVARFWSAVGKGVRQSEAAGDGDAFDRALRDAGAVRRSDYGRTLKALDAAIAPERVLYLFHETLFRQETMDRLTAFLDIAPRPGRFDMVLNGGEGGAMTAAQEGAALERFGHVYDDVRARFGDAVPDAWGRSAVRRAGVARGVALDLPVAPPVPTVMAGLDPAIQGPPHSRLPLDGRLKGGHDENKNVRPASANAALAGKTLLFGVGAQKAGTTWLASYLRGHPEAFVPALKELHYFDSLHRPEQRAQIETRMQVQREALARRRPRPERVEETRARLEELADRERLVRGVDFGYADFFAARAGGERVICDITPGYAMLGEDGFAAMAEAHSATKFVFIMRDPVERFWSALRMRVRRGEAIDTLDGFEDALDDPEVMGRSDYGRTIAALERAVPRDRIKYLFYETLFRQETVDALTSFLGIAPAPASFEAVFNRGQTLAMPVAQKAAALERLRFVYDDIFARFGDAVPAEWRETYRGDQRPAAVAAPAVPGRLAGKTLLIGLGAQKAGSTWLSNYLAEHPEAYVSPLKEVHYFNAVHIPDVGERVAGRMQGRAGKLVRSKAADAQAAIRLKAIEDRARMIAGAGYSYLDYFAERVQGERVFCDITPGYAVLDADVLRAIAALHGKVKFVFIMRDPVARLWSSVRMRARRDAEPGADARRLLEEGAPVDGTIEERSNYARTIAALDRAAAPWQVKYLFYETLFRQDAMDELADFLEIARAPGRFDVVYNRGHSEAMPPALQAMTAARLKPVYEYVLARFGDAVPEAWRQSLALAEG